MERYFRKKDVCTRTRSRRTAERLLKEGWVEITIEAFVNWLESEFFVLRNEGSE